MFGQLKELFKFKYQPPKTITVSVNGIPVHITGGPEEMPALIPNNLEIAEKYGAEVLSFREIRGQLGDKVKNAVLFDTLPPKILMGWEGNHWVVANFDIKNAIATLQLCSPLGNHTYGAIAPVPFDQPFFTGVALMRYTSLEGEPLDLATVQNNPLAEGIILQKETILWPDEDGKLGERG